MFFEIVERQRAPALELSFELVRQENVPVWGAYGISERHDLS